MSKPNFAPFRDRVLVRPLVEEEGAIKTPENGRPKPQRGVVVAVGSGVQYESGYLQPPSFKPGDDIYFGKYAGAEIVLDDEVYLIMREEEILGHIPTVAKLERRANLHTQGFDS
jgi:chaperonin GroES